MGRKYYQLIASLPHLPRFDRAQSLPISRERLLQRLKMLTPEDYQKADQAAAFLAWRRQPIERTPRETVEMFNRAIKLFDSPILREIFEFPINQRTILAALRLKERGAPHPVPGQFWGVGSLVETITRNWEAPFFNLAARYRWIVQAKSYLEEGESLQLEYLLFNLVWDKLDRMLFKNYFDFEAIIAYLIKWDMIQQWLTYKKEAAKEHFEQLIGKVVNEYERQT